MAGAVCGDVDVTHEVAATLPRRTHTLEGALRLRGDESALVAATECGDIELRCRSSRPPGLERGRAADRPARHQPGALARVDIPEQDPRRAGAGA
jgi:hypothetical protein